MVKRTHAIYPPPHFSTYKYSDVSCRQHVVHYNPRAYVPCDCEFVIFYHLHPIPRPTSPPPLVAINLISFYVSWLLLF